MRGEEFSEIYFWLNPIHLLGTRQGKLFPWHGVCLRGRVDPSRALSLLPVLLGINGSTWSPNPPFLSFPFPLLFFPQLFPPFLFSLAHKWQLVACRDCPLSPLRETNSSPRRGLLNPQHSLSLFLLFCKMC